MKQATSRSTAAGAELDEKPTASARLELVVRPFEVRGAAEAAVPGSEAPALIRTFGVVGMSVVGVTAAVVTLLVAPSRALAWFFGLALVELALTTLVVFLIACPDHLAAGVKGSRRGRQRAQDGRGQSKAPSQN